MSSGQRKLIISICAALLIVLICVGATVLGAKKHSNNEQPQTPAVTSQTTAPATPTSVVASVIPATSVTNAQQDPRFSTCAEAKSHGYGPYTRGIDPEYYWYRDQNNNGIVCE